MLGFKKFYNARRVLMGIELMQMIHKGQFDITALESRQFKVRCDFFNNRNN